VSARSRSVDRLEGDPARVERIQAADRARLRREDADRGAAVHAHLEAPDPAVAVAPEPIPEERHGAGLDGDGTTGTTGVAGMIDFTQDFAYACGHPWYGPLPVVPRHLDAHDITDRGRAQRTWTPEMVRATTSR
jgi:hypothetical protein